MGKTANNIEDRVNDRREAGQTLQQDDALDPMQAELLFVEIIHHVSPWVPLNLTPPRESPPTSKNMDLACSEGRVPSALNITLY